MWTKTYGGTGSDIGQGGVVQTSDGGYAIAGATSSFGAGGWDFWLIKTDANGNMQWNKTYGEALDEYSGGMCHTNDGGYALSGYTSSSGAGGNDGWLVKTDAAGNMQWNKTYGGTGDEHVMHVIQCGDGGYAMSGRTSSFGAGGNDSWLIKTDAFGNMQWNKTYGGTGDDVSTSVVQNSDGSYTMAGVTNSFGASGTDAWLVKTDATGNTLWNKTYGGSGSDGAESMIQTSDGGYATIGYTRSFGGIFKAYLVKTDSSGNMQWYNAYEGDTDFGIHMIQTADGGYAIVGYSFLSSTNADFLLIKTDASGNMQWKLNYGGTAQDNGYDLVQTSDGGYALLGKTASSGAGDMDFWLVKTDGSGVIPEGLTLGAMLLLSSVAVIVSARYFRKRSKWEKW
jgi:predicted secreted protein